MLSLIVILFVAFMLPGVIARTRAVLSGRKGVMFYRHINLLGVMLQKGAVYSSVSGFIFRIAPLVYLSAIVTAVMMIPVGGFKPIFSFEGDVVLICYLLALSRLSLILAAMDTGSSFEGMGASREAMYGALIEPALFVIFGTLALVSGYTSLTQIFLNVNGNSGVIIVMVLVMYLLFKIILVESGRIPVDDPHTHLELTMIHEVMVLDYCGFDLAMITLGGWIKMGLLTVIASSAVASVLDYAAIPVILLCGVIGVSIGILESFVARSRMVRNATYIMTILALALLLFMVAFVIVHDITIE